jgi:hypothetical protein
VRHLVRGDIERDERTGGDPITITVGHLRAVPVCIDVVAAVVHPALNTLAVIEDSVAAEVVLVEVPGLGRAVVRVDRSGGSIGVGAVAPVVARP